ncbi:NAD-dependent epimerase/dehydratase family protein [candidate division KSB1 bacterium]|nr:NAD-dependent epimerase/dehydratase family protein [candidate division KSB1 bacterium]
MSKKVFVTGASGFTGGHLCRILTGRGYSVKALVRKSSKVETLEKLGVELVYGDLANVEAQNGALKDVDTVFHVAAAYRQEGISTEQFWKVNVDGTRTLLESARDSGVKRFVHCSTVGVQGEIENPPAKETAPYKPGDHYQESKMEGEKLALRFFEEHDIEGVVVRPVGIYGPGDTRFLKLFKFINNGRFRMIGKGDVLYHLTYVEDLVDGIILAGEKDKAVGKVYTIGGNEYLKLKELVEMIAEVLGKPVPKNHLPLKPVYVAAVVCEAICRPLGIEPPLYRRRLDFFTKDRAFDISQAKADLRYEPKVPLKEGLATTATWYKEQGLI